MAADPMALNKSCHYVHVGKPWSAITTGTITTTGGCTAVYYCGRCGKEKRNSWWAGSWPPVDYCGCEPICGNDASVKPAEQLSADPWRCPGCGVFYGPSVQSCDCSKHLKI